jgi:ATP-dependent DNA helicase RecQ
MIIDILRGGKSEKLLSAGLDSLSTYGIMADTEARHIRAVMDYLIKEDYLALEGEEYPVVKTGSRWQEIIVEKKPLSMMLAKESPEQRGRRSDPSRRESPEPADVFGRSAPGGLGRPGRPDAAGPLRGRPGQPDAEAPAPRRPASGAPGQSALPVYKKPEQKGGLVLSEADEELMTKLKDLRKILAREAAVPAYIIFSDASLRDMCLKKPATLSAFEDVNGVGRIKLGKYGEAFTALIREHVRGN